MFELADRMVGVYKTHNSTKSVTINPKKFAAKATSLSLSASQGGAASQAAAGPAAPALGDATNQQAVAKKKKAAPTEWEQAELLLPVDLSEDDRVHSTCLWDDETLVRIEEDGDGGTL